MFRSVIFFNQQSPQHSRLLHSLCYYLLISLHYCKTNKENTQQNANYQLRTQLTQLSKEKRMIKQSVACEHMFVSTNSTHITRLLHNYDLLYKHIFTMSSMIRSVKQTRKNYINTTCIDVNATVFTDPANLHTNNRSRCVDFVNQNHSHDSISKT